jgi:dihydroflavonol-4-reductase
MKALVTGATGFTGGYLVENLLDYDYEVRALVRPTSNIDKLKSLGVEFSFGDIRNKEEVDDAVQGVDIVFHIAAIFRSAGIPNSVYWNINVHGTENVLEASLRHRVKRIVHCSTGGVHGHIIDPPARETTPYKPSDVYQESKAEGEKLALHYHRTKGLSVTVVRPTGIYGPGDFRMLKMYRMIQNRRFIMLGSGNTLYHLTYVTDLVEGIRLAGEKVVADGEVYFIAGENHITLNQFAGLIADELGVRRIRWHFPVFPVYSLGFLCEKICVPLRVEPPIYRRRVDFFTQNHAFDITKAKQDLGYSPKVEPQEGIHLTTEWYKLHGYLKMNSKA